jgi:FixJ family two-component response regulator
MKSGAVAFLTKPIDEVAPIAGVERALDLNKTYRKEAFEHSPPREQQVLPLLASGPLNKQAAGELGTSENAVQMHRGISCGKWKPIPSRSWLRSPASHSSGPVAHPNRKCVWPVSYKVL